MTNSAADGGILELLSKLEEDDLFALARTITQGLLKINSKDVLEFWNVSNNKSEIKERESETTQEIDKRKPDESSVALLAEQFSKWFYSMMNSVEFIGAEHFYPDARLNLNVYTNDNCDTSVIENDPAEIVQSLRRIKMQHNLFFNPNVTKDGVQGRMDPHGLVMVLVCGTLHVQQACVGVFEQVFALARDPFCDNNWKIKNSELNLKSKSGVLGPPSLCDSELTSSLLTLPLS
ncbi:hypothetical protein NQ318_009299 [Aromia moschata]|uniref:NTF2 domain-containing protein n=1 Tax=Aromia moschata TaxID=1265417 RepID=A0AAV8YKZ3_9CUCU|nr:hypothetical protein NQ318_009299 [Aromia moschata]